ncbi:fimbrial biogenesis chaperone [Sphingomonas adhaesiva]|uniref:fimbrial biogenesis chaperone n=1 Tax=Sphingomonas adhaesiva TaxID=28212 RepID=UPI002FFCCD36
MRLPLFALLTSALATVALPHPALAATVVIWPVDPVIRAGEQTAAMWLENKGAEPVTLQVRTFAWSQARGEDQLDAQEAVVASPPIATVAPGARQLVRIIRRAPEGAPETAYRLLIDELPRPAPRGPDGAVQARLGVQMRYSIPLFTHATATPGTPQLDARIAAGPDGRVLSIRNTGTAHARLTDLRLVTGTREVTVHAGLTGYVLPGATVTFALPGGEAGRVKVTVNGTDRLLDERA